MSIDQLNLVFDPLQDRLLLRIGTISNQEYRLWLTRRLVMNWWPALLKMLTNSGATLATAASAPVQRALLEMRHEHAMQNAVQNESFDQPYRAEGKQAILGTEPILVQSIQMRPQADGQYQLQFSPRDGEGVLVSLHEHLLHALLKLLEDGARGSDWGLTLERPLVTVETISKAKLN